MGLHVTTFGMQVVEEKALECLVGRVSVLFAAKPASTLDKRLCSLRLYHTWCVSSCSFPFPVEEETVCKYLLHCSDTTATRGATFRSGLAFVGGYFGLPSVDQVLRRCQGAMYRGLEKKAVMVQATPLTVDQVVFFEKAAVEAGDLRNRCLSGFASRCLHARLRVGDAVSARVEPFLDAPVGEYGGGCRFIETEVTRHNRAHRANRSRASVWQTGFRVRTDPKVGSSAAVRWVSMLQLTAVFKGLHVRMALGASAP